MAPQTSRLSQQQLSGEYKFLKTDLADSKLLKLSLHLELMNFII